MTLFLFWSIVTLLFIVNIDCTLGQRQAVQHSDIDMYSGLTERELILTLMKRIDDQQTDINSLQVTVQQQNRKLGALEAVLEREHETADTFEDVDQANLPPKRQTEESPKVAFYASANQHLINLGVNQPLEFENVITNIGNAYNPHTGIFTAPYHGTYVFAVSIMAYNRTASHYYMAKNGIFVSWIYTRGIESMFSSSSHNLVIELSKNDDLEVRSYEAGNDVHGQTYSCFSGFLLYVDDHAGAIVG